MTLSPDSASWITTLIQIGIPSLVTLASLFVTFRLGRASHQKDIAIANLAADSERRKMTNERKANLIAEITAALAEVENAHSAYSGLFRRSKIKDVSAPIEPSHELQAAFGSLSSAIDKCCGARTAVYLLGNSSVSSLFELYLQDNFGFQAQANPIHSNASPIDLNDSFVALSSRRIKLLGLLSDLYLDKASTGRNTYSSV
ncbi:hypothetical protein ACLBKS_13105 [Hylemonella sp. W303a]|uniref:hypothetical protein n=1 Tax=Hylemonella sp. W303a TaxID=3389873 RepID=UPI00396B22D9